MVSNDTGIRLGDATHWHTVDAESVHTEETAHTYPLLEADKVIGLVRRHDFKTGKWTFRIFRKHDSPQGVCDTKEEALEGARKELIAPE